MLKFILWFLFCCFCGFGAAAILAHFMIGAWMVWFFLGSVGVTYVQCAFFAGFLGATTLAGNS